MRLHLGHHFYGAGNLGDDFMLAGFLAAFAPLAPGARCTACVPFPLGPLRARFPGIEWLPYDETRRAAAIAGCDAWLGLGGSPFQHAQSRWFVDHLAGDAALCRRSGRPMFFLGVGIQTAGELGDPVVRDLCLGAARLWTRDAPSAARLLAALPAARAAAAADLSHILFADTPPPPAVPGRIGLVPNFDYGTWPGQAVCLAALADLGAAEQIWLAQETRELPGAERALHAALPPAERARWDLVVPDQPGAPLASVLPRWPSGEWLVTARFHAALAAAWAGSKVVVVAVNEKLRGVAAEFGLPAIPPDADRSAVTAALAAARPVPRAVLLAARDRAAAAVRSFAAAVAR